MLYSAFSVAASPSLGTPSAPAYIVPQDRRPGFTCFTGSGVYGGINWTLPQAALATVPPPVRILEQENIAAVAIHTGAIPTGSYNASCAQSGDGGALVRRNFRFNVISKGILVYNFEGKHVLTDPSE